MHSVVQGDRSVDVETTGAKSGVATGTTQSPGARVRRCANSIACKTQAQAGVPRIRVVARPPPCPQDVATSPFSTQCVNTRLTTSDKPCVVIPSGIGTLTAPQSHRGYPITAPTKTVVGVTRSFVGGTVSENT